MYATKKDTTELQVELSSLKQKTGETALTHEQRVNQLAIEL